MFNGPTLPHQSHTNPISRIFDLFMTANSSPPFHPYNQTQQTSGYILAHKAHFLKSLHNLAFCATLCLNMSLVKQTIASLEFHRKEYVKEVKMQGRENLERAVLFAFENIARKSDFTVFKGQGSANRLLLAGNLYFQFLRC